VTASGTVKPKVKVTISSEVSGEVVVLPVEDGDHVKQGQLLARINTDVLQSRVDQQRAAITATKATAQQNLVQLQRAEQTLADQKKLFEQKFISEDSLRDYQKAVDVCKAQYDAAKANIAAQQAQVDEAEKSLSKAIIYSPMDGIVTYRAVELGDRVVGTGDYSGTTIMTVADYGIFNVELDVNENDIVNVAVGDKAKIAVDAIGDKKYTGTVVQIATSSESTNSSSSSSSTSSTSEENTSVTFLVKVRFDNPDDRQRPGMTATADIDTNPVDGVVAVPLQSVTVRDKQTVAKAEGKIAPDAPVLAEHLDSKRKDNDKKSRAEIENLQRVVFIYNDGKVQLREVKTGVCDNRYMEIKEGVKEGEQVVSGSYNAIARELNDGMKVNIATKDAGKGKPSSGGSEGGSH
jgi:HlyD family secretion protein